MKYEITEEQIKQLAKGNDKVKEWFPEVFETKLEVGKWYKRPKYGNSIFNVQKITDRYIYAYGLTYEGNWVEFSEFSDNDELETYFLATDSEVLEALTNEAKKRGFKNGVFVKTLWSELDYWKLDTNRFAFNSETNNLHLGPCIFHNGKWAEIIKTYTKEEAEKLLNAKII